MPSPDLRDYVDLTIFDRSAAALAAQALLDATVRLPGWTPREGNTEVVLIEALAVIVAEQGYAINRVPGAVVEVLLRLFDIERDIGAPPTATVTFTVSDAAGHTIPEGTRVRLDLGTAADPLTFTVDADVIISGGSTTGVAAVTGSRNTEDANGVAIGTAVQVLDAVAYINSAVLATSPALGEGSETTLEYLERGSQRLARLAEALVLPAHFTARALEETDVERATTIDLYDGVGPSAGTDTGHVTVAVYGLGAVLSAGRKTAIEALLEDAAVANLDVHVIDPTITVQNVTATVKALPGYATATVQASVVAALTAYLDPATWDWSATIRYNELIALMSNVAGVDYVSAMSVPAADVALTGSANLADLGTATITVT